MNQDQINEIKWAAQAALTTAQDNQVTAQAAVDTATAALATAQEAVTTAQTALNEANELIADPVPVQWFIPVEAFGGLLTSGGVLSGEVTETVTINGVGASTTATVTSLNGDANFQASEGRWRTNTPELTPPTSVVVQVGSNDPFTLEWSPVV